MSVSIPISASPVIESAEFLADLLPVAREDRARGRSARANEARRASGRRRNIDPTTTDRHYSGAEVEFMGAMQAYKQSSGRPFPTWSEALEVLAGLGYTRPDRGGDR